jgi:hypothetical protein
MKRAIPGFVLLALLLPLPVYAGAGKGDVAGAVLFGPLMAALFLLPLAVGVQGLVLAYAPRRGRGLLHATANHRAKTLALGLINSVFAFFFVAATGGPAPALALLGALTWLVLLLVGLHGIARPLGARVLGRDLPGGPPADVVETAVGLVVLLFACSVPILGLFLAAYWTLRATGGAILSLLAVESPPSPGSGKPDPESPPSALGE